MPRVSFDDLVILLPNALALCVMAIAETITVGDSMAKKHAGEIRPNQESVAVGAANIFSGLVQGFVVDGGASQLAANDTAVT